MAVTKEDILDAISSMSIMDVVELISSMEDKFGVTAAAPVAVAAVPADGGASVAEEQTEFSVVLTSFGSNKIAVIKVIRSLTDLGLKEAKTLVEGAPSDIKTGISKEDADSMKKQLEEAGASVEIK